MEKPTNWHRLVFPIMGYFRRKRSRYLERRFPGMATMTICDLGGSRHFWKNMSVAVPRKNITIYNVHDDECRRLPGGDEEQIRFVFYDGLNIPAPDKHFDLLICNSVLEHVPLRHRKQVASEIMRVSKRFFCQTPAYGFPFEPHFFLPCIHWLPKRCGRYLLFLSPLKILSRQTREAIEVYFGEINLLRERELGELFPGASVEREKALGLVKSFYVIGE